jgi:integrase
VSTWSLPYVTVLDKAGNPVTWSLPDVAPWPAGACAEESLRTPVDLGLPTGGTIKVRWRTPSHANPRSRTTPTSDLQTVALACDVVHAAGAQGNGWMEDANGWPIRVRPTLRVTADAPACAAPVVELPEPPLTGSYASVSANNAALVDIRTGRRELGATVSQIITAIRRQREPGWSGAHKTNMNNALGFLEQVLVNSEPVEDELAEVASWRRARLDLPGVEVGESMHVALLLGPDLERAIEIRRQTDRRTDLLNEQAVTRFLAEWDHYQKAVAARELKPCGGRPPKRPADEPVLREPELPVMPRTEELFATCLAMVLGYAEQNGLLVGPNPWPVFISRGQTRTGYRRSEHVRPHQRNVPPVGVVVDIADHIATLGPINPATGKPTGDRYRAMVLTALLGPRPSELDALDPDDFTAGPTPTLLVARSASTVHKLASADGSSLSIREGLKHRELGESRTLDMPGYIADAISEHIAAGYAANGRLFTSPQGQPLRWGNTIDTYWRPAVTHVLGASSSPLLRDMPRRWLRKAAITWMIRAGLGVEQIAALTGHDVMTLYTHYAGIVAGHDARHTWTGWGDAWAWAVQEHDVP